LLAAATSAVAAQPPGVLVGVLSPGLFTAHSSASFLGSFLERLGLPSALEPRGSETQFQLSLEGLAASQAGAIVLLCNPGDDTPLAGWRGDPLWNALPAVRAGRVYLFDRDLWSKGRGLQAFELILDEISASGLLQGSSSTTSDACGEA
jgi:ABC-type Fe3+-citrate transport system substrate-binding protein